MRLFIIFVANICFGTTVIMKIKRKYFGVALIVALVFFNVSCVKEKIDYRTLEYYNEFFVSEENKEMGSLEISVSMDLPTEFPDNELILSVQKQIVAKIFGDRYNYIDIDTVLATYAENIANEYIKSNLPFLEKINDLEGSKAFLDNQIDIVGSLLYFDENIISYSYEHYAYLGGAHGNSRQQIFNFDMQDASVFSEKDVFIDNYSELLSDLIKEQIVANKAEIESVADLSDFNYYEKEIKPNNNFIVDNEGITYVYNPYDIAPYSMGQTAVFLSYEVLKPILRKDSPINKIINK